MQPSIKSVHKHFFPTNNVPSYLDVKCAHCTDLTNHTLKHDFLLEHDLDIILLVAAVVIAAKNGEVNQWEKKGTKVCHSILL